MNFVTAALLVCGLVCLFTLPSTSGLQLNAAHTETLGKCLEALEKDYAAHDTGNVPDAVCVKFSEAVNTDAKVKGQGYPYELNFKAGDTDTSLPKILACIKEAIKAAGGADSIVSPGTGCKAPA